MGLQLRQICLVAHHLAPAIDDLSAVFGIEACFVDPAVGVFGLENTLLSVGRNFLEVVAPVREGTAAGRYLERRHGDGGYMVICQTSDAATQADCRRRAAEAGVRVAWQHDEGSHHYMQLHPGDMQAAFFEVDWDAHAELDGYWGAAGGRGWEPHVRTDVVGGFTGVELQGPDPRALAEHWGQVAGLPVLQDEAPNDDPGPEDGAPYLQLENARIRFVPDRDGRGPGLAGVDLSVRDRAFVVDAAMQRGALVEDEIVQICGTRFYLR